MTQVINKYVVNPSGLTNMPLHARLLTVGAQHHEVVIWAVVEPNKHGPRNRKLYCHMTGEAVIEGGNYVGTVKLDSYGMPNGLVVHVFDHGYEHELKYLGEDNETR